ncbi:T9SS type A sorting domain-containing protein [bacterium]|nr:T9SS type A sorting domain-containing protein [bacterium]
MRNPALDSNTGLFVHVDGSNTIRVIDRLVLDESAILNTITHPGAACNRVVLCDTLAFIADDSDSIQVYSIANLPEMQFLTAYSNWRNGERLMPPDMVEDGRAYHIESGQSGSDLVVFDLFSGDEPVYLSTLPLPSSSIQVMDEHMFAVADNDSSLIVVDIADLAHPDTVCVMPFDVEIRGLSRADEFLVLMLMLTDHPRRDYQIVDVSDPTEPTLRGSFHEDLGCYLGDVDSHRLYLLADVFLDDDFIRIVDFSNPDSLVHEPDIPLDSDYFFAYQNYLWMSNHYTYVPMKCYDITDPANPDWQPAFNGFTELKKANVQSDKVYLLDELDGFRIVDISDPADPYETGYIHQQMYSMDLSIADEVVYLSTDSGLCVINTADPDQPQVVDTLDLDDTNSATDGTTLAVQTSRYPGYYDVYLYDISVPTEPELATIIDVPPNGNTIFEGNIVGFENGILVYSTTYVNEHPPYTNYTHVRAIEASDPWNPQSISLDDVDIGNYEHPYLALHDNLLFVLDELEPGDDDDAIRIYQLSTYADPVLLSESLLTGTFYSPMITDSRLFLRDQYTDTFRVIDFSDPSNPELYYEGEGAYPLYADYPYIIGEHDNQLLILDGSTVLGVEDEPGSTGSTTIPAAFAMHPVSPNPCNNQARLTFDLPAPARLTVSVYDILGREVSRINQRYSFAGTHSLEWDGSELASGIYFVRASAGPWNGVRKIVLLK